ncbi:GtrA family protein [Chelativorans sp.]|uniref:GtrA family protein n=1 Tax=Chelativorans sp. TaxID=2203393 RepID=UPI0035C72166
MIPSRSQGSFLTSSSGIGCSTFRYSGEICKSSGRYVACYASGYVLNLILLYVVADQLGYPHQVVQAFAIVIVAIFLFFTLNAFVFRKTPAPRGR